MQRFLAIAALAGAFLVLPMGGAAEERGKPLREGATPGDYCLPGGCKPAPAPAWNAAAFGLAAGLVAWRARHRAPTGTDA